MSKAFTPQEVIERQSAIVTDWMIDFINRRLLAEWNGINAFVKKSMLQNILKTEDIIQKPSKKMADLTLNIYLLQLVGELKQARMVGCSVQ